MSLKKPIVDFFHNNYVPDSISLGYIKYQKLLSKISNVERLFSLFMMFCKDRNLLDDFFTYIQSKGYYLDTLSPFTVYETTNKQDIDYDEKAKSGDYINLDESSFVKNCLFVYDSHHTDGLPAIGNINGQPIVSLEGLYVKVIDDISMMTNPIHKINDFLMQKLSKYDSKHNALYDAFVIKRCYEILLQ